MITGSRLVPLMNALDPGQRRLDTGGIVLTGAAVLYVVFLSPRMLSSLCVVLVHVVFAATLKKWKLLEMIISQSFNFLSASDLQSNEATVPMGTIQKSDTIVELGVGLLNESGRAEHARFFDFSCRGVPN